MTTVLEDAQASMREEWLKKKFPRIAETERKQRQLDATLAKLSRRERKKKERIEEIRLLINHHQLPKLLYDGPEFIAFNNAKGRCNYPSHPSFVRYGGRGIQFKFSSFRQFYDHIGPRPEGRTIRGRALYSLHRIDNNGNYEIGNVEWTTQKNQCSEGNRRTPLETAADKILAGTV